MKTQTRVSQLILELYHRGLATRKETKLVENVLATDSAVRNRYEALKESEREINQLVTKELARVNLPETPIVQPPRGKKVAGFVLAAAVLLCALIPTFLYIKHSNSNKGNAIAESSSEGSAVVSDTEVENIAQASTGKENHEDKTEPNVKPGGVTAAAPPQADAQIFGASTPSEEEPTITIPPGITFIFENMFANKQLSAVVIPDRITSIRKNAFTGNPLVSVTIGINVAVDDEAFPGNFANVYNNSGKAAGTYTRHDKDSEAWEKE